MWGIYFPDSPYIRLFASTRSALLVPNVRASPGQASTQAGFSPFCSRSQQRLHFWILGVALSYSNFGMSMGQDTMQNRQPMQLSSQVTGPSLRFSIAFTRQAETHPGWLQCMHCFLAKTSPFSVLKLLTTVHCFS